jgi:hypothetical protein
MLADVLLNGLLPELLKGLLEKELLNGLLLKDELLKKNVPDELPLELHQLLPLLNGLELHQLLLLPLKGVELKELLLPENELLLPDEDELPDVEDAGTGMRVIPLIQTPLESKIYSDACRRQRHSRALQMALQTHPRPSALNII